MKPEGSRIDDNSEDGRIDTAGLRDTGGGGTMKRLVSNTALIELCKLRRGETR